MNLGIRIGLTGGLLSIAITLAGFLLDVQYTTWFRWCSMLVVILIIIYGLVEQKKEDSNLLSFGQALATGMTVSVTHTLVSMLFLVFYINFIDTGYFEGLKENLENQYVEQGYSPEQIASMMEFSNRFISLNFLLITGIITAIFVGFLVSLVVGAFMSNEST